jgi:glutaredoxin 2
MGMENECSIKYESFEQVRVRLALGVKNIKHQLVFMANDDVTTPSELVGKKIAPILELRADRLVMPESMDIIKYFDDNPRFGLKMIAPASGRTDLVAWQSNMAVRVECRSATFVETDSSFCQDTMRSLVRPRYMLAPLPEFMQKDSRDAFVKNHEVPPFLKVRDENVG